MFRTADGAGIEKLYLTGITPTPLDRFGKIREPLRKVSLGAEQSVPWEKHASAIRLIEKLKKEGYKIFAVEQSKKSIAYYQLKGKSLKSNVAFIVGNEVQGLPRTILAKCDKILEIPMHGKKESLNVAVAFGIIAFHFAHVFSE